MDLTREIQWRTAEERVDDDFMRILGDNIFRANLGDVVRRRREERTDAAFLVEEVPYEEASRYGVWDTNRFGEIADVIEKPADPPSNLVMTGVDTVSPAIFRACELVPTGCCSRQRATRFPCSGRLRNGDHRLEICI